MLDPRYEWVEVWPGTFQLKETEWYGVYKEIVEEYKDLLIRLAEC
jgi:hypothetical protein